MLSLKTIRMPPGSHGVHIHSVGTCEPRSFVSAGPHLNPFNKMHGTLNPQGSHLGDLPNLVIAPDQTGSLIIKLPPTTTDLEAFIFDSDGSALVIHDAADDYLSDPSGNSGSRIACGVLIKEG